MRNTLLHIFYNKNESRKSCFPESEVILLPSRTVPEFHNEKVTINFTPIYTRELIQMQRQNCKLNLYITIHDSFTTLDFKNFLIVKNSQKNNDKRYATAHISGCHFTLFESNNLLEKDSFKQRKEYK